MQEKYQLYADKNRPNVDKISLFVDKKGAKNHHETRAEHPHATPQTTTERTR